MTRSLFIRLTLGCAMVATILGTSAGCLAQSEQILYPFEQTTSGSFPNSPLAAGPDGSLYGTTQSNGPHTHGSVFMLSPEADGSWKLKVLHAFGAYDGDGIAPHAGLAFDKAGNLYGTTASGGTYGYGTVFQLSPTEGSWQYRVLHGFTGNSDGALPDATPVVDSAGNVFVATEGLYGVARFGSIVELSPQSSGSWKATVIYDFGPKPDTHFPVDLVVGPDGNLYGVGSEGGPKGGGTIFELSKSDEGTWSETVLHTFGTFGSGDALGPVGIEFDAHGNIFGISHYGGRYYDGTIFELPHNSDGTWGPEILIHSFGSSGDGSLPLGRPTFDDTGALYGTTLSGGSAGEGILYKFSPSSSGTWTGVILHDFLDGTDGAGPSGTPILDGAGNLYGATYYGGMFDVGTVWKLTP